MKQMFYTSNKKHREWILKKKTNKTRCCDERWNLTEYMVSDHDNNINCVAVQCTYLYTPFLKTVERGTACMCGQNSHQHSQEYFYNTFSTYDNRATIVPT